MPFEFQPLPLAGLVAITPKRFGDDRGWFSETYKYHEYATAGIAYEFVQDNMSLSHAATLRGLHYQLPPHAQGKLVQVTSGRVWDVAVDIRRGSETFGKWYGIELDARTGRLLWIPPGFAHGFAVLEDNTQVVYKCTSEYHAASERSILYRDDEISIQWPKISGFSVYRLSFKDENAPYLKNAELFP